MTNNKQLQESNELPMERKVVYEVGGQEVTLTPAMVKNYLVRGNSEVSDQEVVMFLNLCRYQKLNPFLNEAYLVKFGGQPAQIITSKEAYMKRAFADPSFEGFKAGIIVQRGEETLELEGSFSLPGDQLLGGWAEVYAKGRKYPYVAKIGMDEFSKGQATWKSMPKTMIRKTALVQALREGFPDSLGAMYVEEESEDIRETSSTEVEMEVSEEIKEQANKEIIDIPVEASYEIVQEEPEERVSRGEEKAPEQADLFKGPDF